MKLRRLGTVCDPMPNMTAMVDLIMCILIFFMLASKFVGSEMFLPGALPTDRGIGNIPDEGPLVAHELLVDLSAGGGLGVVVELPQSGVRFPAPAAVPADEPAQLSAMTRYMDRVTAELRRVRDATAGNVRVVLRPSPEVEYRHVVRVLGALREAEFKQVAFAATGRAG